MTFFNKQTDLILNQGAYSLLLFDIKTRIPFLNDFQNHLSEDEYKRSKKLLFEKDRQTFIICRSLTRMVLSGQLNMEPKQILFSYNGYGKPALSASMNREDITFNLSHSGSSFLLGIARKKRIGVDVEIIRSGKNIPALVDRFFTEEEKRHFFNFAPSERERIFFKWLVLKESIIKAIGMGFNFKIQNFSVPLHRTRIDNFEIKLEHRSKKQTFLLTHREFDTISTAVAFEK